jgi:hypothetical protein
MTLVGPVVLDIVQHFVERWNEIKKRKVRVLCPLLSQRILRFPVGQYNGGKSKV